MPEPKALRWRIEDALKRSDLKADARHVLWVLLSLADVGTGVVPPAHTPSYSSLARDTGLARSTVVSRVRELARDGWLHVQPPPVAEQVSKKARNRYRVCLPTGPALGLVRHSDQSEDQTGPRVGPALVRGSAATGPAAGLTTDPDHPDPPPARAQESTDESGRTRRADGTEVVWRSRRARAERLAACLGDGWTADEADTALQELQAHPPPWMKRPAAYVDARVRSGDRDDLLSVLPDRPPPAVPPLCGACEGNDVDGVASRLVPGTDTPCPACHPRGAGRAS